MTPPIVTETPRDLQPVEHDPFIDDVSRPAPLPATTRRRIID